MSQMPHLGWHSQLKSQIDVWHRHANVQKHFELLIFFCNGWTQSPQMQHHKLCNSKSSIVIAGLILLIAIMQMCLAQNQKNEKNSKSQKWPMTHLGIEFVRTSFLTC
jgi:hypothetical protein